VLPASAAYHHALSDRDAPDRRAVISFLQLGVGGRLIASLSHVTYFILPPYRHQHQHQHQHRTTRETRDTNMEACSLTCAHNDTAAYTLYCHAHSLPGGLAVHVMLA